jgi:hypothetical protein
MDNGPPLTEEVAKVGGDAMSRNEFLLMALVLVLLSGAIFLQAKYQPYPELNFRPGNIARPAIL